MAESQETPKVTPHDLILRCDVEKALHADKGSNATLKSFDIQDFTTKGDNYSSVVSCVNVQYEEEKDGRNPRETTYIAKINPCRNAGEMFEHGINAVFRKEAGFFSRILPMLNKELEKANERKLRMAEYYHSAVEEDGKQVIYLEDLRRSGFKMFNHRESLDKAHVELIIQELARMHAASRLVMKTQNLSGAEFLEKFPVLCETLDEMKLIDVIPGELDLFGTSMENAALLTDIIPGYEYVSDFLREKKVGIVDSIRKVLEIKEPFTIISHGDCWTNNFLFRYSGTGKVLECRLLDLQIVRVASPVLDLNHMVYTSLSGDVRRAVLPGLIRSYYDSFARILEESGEPMEFTFEQLEEELKEKQFFGFLWGSMTAPVILLDSEDTLTLEDFLGSGNAEGIKRQQEKINKMMANSPHLRPRLLSLYDEMTECGLMTKPSSQ